MKDSNVGMADAKEAPWYKTGYLIHLYALLLAPMITITAWGFDLSMTNSLQALDEFNNRFDHPSGSRLGFYGASTSVGGLASIFVTPYLIDRFGRRVPIFIGSVLIVSMAIMETFASSFEMFVGGKVLLGFGAFISLIASPTLVTELAHPYQRTRITTIYNTGIYFGLIVGSWIAFGTRTISGNAQWQIPTGLQAVLPVYQAIMIWFCPESPRWLAMRGRTEAAKKILVKYHGGGQDTTLVQEEFRQIITGLEVDQTQLRLTWKDVKTHLSHKGNLHRLFIATTVAVGSQCCGSGLISSYLPTILDQVGLTTTKEKTMISGIINIWSWVVGITASMLMPKLRRRVVFLFGTAGMILTFVVWTALAAMYVQNSARGYGIGVVAMIFVYNFFYSCSWLPLNVAYPLEIVTTKQRGLYFSWTLFSISASGFAVNYVNPVGIASLGWKYYIITIAFTCLVWVAIYFTFVETKDLSLEQIAIRFDGTLEGLYPATSDKSDISKDQSSTQLEEVGEKNEAQKKHAYV